MAKRWYIVHAYSNFENKVAESIREQAKQRGLTDLFEEILVPKEKVTEVRRGRKIDTATLTRERPSSTSSTTPLNDANGPSDTRTCSPTSNDTEGLGRSMPSWT